jgi:hypothetical protein
MSTRMKKIWIMIFGIGIGVIYGIILGIGGICDTGGGDGSFVLFELFSAPLGMGFAKWMDSSSIMLSISKFYFLWHVPLLWGIGGFLVSMPEKKLRRYALMIFMGMHYISAIVAFFVSDFINWHRFLYSYFNQFIFASVVVAFLLIYLLGQVWLWKRLLDTFGKKEAA